jgi:hypothetical protein
MALVGTYVPEELAEQFKTWARETDGGASAALRRMIAEAVKGHAPVKPLGAAGHQVLIRLKEKERLALLRAAKQRNTTPANWLRSLAMLHLNRQSNWSPDESAALQQIALALIRIVDSTDRMARALDESGLPGVYSAPADSAVIRNDMRRLIETTTVGADNLADTKANLGGG